MDRQENRLSIDGDSLESSSRESELEKLRFELKQKEGIISEKSEIIGSLRQQVNDLQEEIEELETNEQFLNQKVDRITKEHNEKSEELDAVSAALKEVEQANETLSKRMEARTSQLQKLVEDLTKAKKELQDVQMKNEELVHKNEHMSIEVDMAKSRRKPSRDDDETDEIVSKEVLRLKNELETTEQSWQIERQHKERYARENLLLDRKLSCLHQELSALKEKNAELETKCISLESRLHRDEESDLNSQDQQRIVSTTEIRSQPLRTVEVNIAQKHLSVHQSISESQWQSQSKVTKTAVACDENAPNFGAAMRFPMADEVGEIMESSSSLLTRQKAAMTATVNATMLREKRLHSDESLAWEQHYDNYHSKRATQQQQQQQQKDRQMSSAQQQIEQQQQAQPSSLNSRDNYCSNHRIKKSQFFEIDSIDEQKMRLERANELARRNMQTKPLHQTSYPLELDTFGTTDLTETEIKRGNLPRQALANFSNQQHTIGQQQQQQQTQAQKLHHQPQQQMTLQYQQTIHQQQQQLPMPRRPVKKAEAFIV